MWALCVASIVAGAELDLDTGTALLAKFKVEEALVHLQRALAAGSRDYAANVRLFEQLGVAYAYLDENDRAGQAFDYLLTLDPGHAISYTLSPKATFLFERARRQAQQRPAPRLQLTWPQGLGVQDRIPIVIEVVTGPQRFFHHGRLFLRMHGAGPYRPIDVPLPPVGEYITLDVPPPMPEAVQRQTVELHFVAYDAVGNEVYLESSADRPRTLSLSYTEPEPWYRKWWVWVSAGIVMAAATGAAVYASTRELPERIGGEFSIAP